MIRHAVVHDVPAMSKLINDCAEYGLMLHRPLSFLYERIRDFHVAVEGEQVVGVCGLSVVWADLAEVYALVVAPSFRGHGQGKKLVQACVQEARSLGVRNLMTLTYEQAFFQRSGFQAVDRQQLPLKVWSQCVRCSRNHACDEIAMIRVLQDVPETAVTTPDEPAQVDYDVPVTLSVIPSPSVKHRDKMDEAY